MKAAKIRTKRPLLVLLFGFPGSGKTHFSRNVVDHLQSAHVHGDRIRHELFETPRYDKQENSVVNQLMEYMSEEFLSAGISVVFDANAMRLAQRRQLRDMARKHKADSVIVWFQMDPESAFMRTQKRDRRTIDDKYAREYSDDLFAKYISHMQQPTNEDYVVVSGKHVFSTQRSAFFKKLIELGYVESSHESQDKVAKPGLINLIPRNQSHGRVDMQRRNINVR